MKIEHLSALEIGSHIAAGDLTSVEATQYFLTRISELNAGVNAFVHVAEEAAVEQARDADRRISSGKLRGPLAGVPIAIKDVLCTKTMPTTCGSRVLKDFTPPYSATAVEKILAAGMVPIGKTNMDEFAMGGSTETSCHGVTRNPWDTSKTAGGSSGGAAASLAAGMIPLSIGSDTGGSVRQPAALCGVCGLKPTYGRISRYGLVAFASSLDQVGPLAHCVEDLAASLEVMAGHDPLDSTSLKDDVPEYSASLRDSIQGLKIGMIREHIEHEALDSEVAQGVERARQALEQLGAKIIDIHLPNTQYSVPTYYLVAPSEASGNLSRYDGVHYGARSLGSASADSPLDAMISRSRSQGFGDEVKRRIMLGTFALSAGYYDAYYKKALQVRRLIADDYSRAFEDVDLLLGPVTPTPAFELGDKINDPVQMYLEDLFTVGANLAGLPGISLPSGFSSAGLPLGVQLQGPVLGEAKLLNAAYQLQESGFFGRQLAGNN